MTSFFGNMAAASLPTFLHGSYIRMYWCRPINQSSHQQPCYINGVSTDAYQVPQFLEAFHALCMDGSPARIPVISKSVVKGKNLGSWTIAIFELVGVSTHGFDFHNDFGSISFCKKLKFMDLSSIHARSIRTLLYQREPTAAPNPGHQAPSSRTHLQQTNAYSYTCIDQRPG